jgi:hypothetical protein
MKGILTGIHWKLDSYFYEFWNSNFGFFNGKGMVSQDLIQA